MSSRMITTGWIQARRSRLVLSVSVAEGLMAIETNLARSLKLPDCEPLDHSR